MKRDKMRRVITCVLLAAGLAACEGPPQVQTVDHIDLMTPPMASNFDRDPAPDGIQTRVFLYSGSQSVQTVKGSGTLELLLFDGRVGLHQAAVLPPLRAWSFSPEELDAMTVKWNSLWCYQMSLRWGEARPQTSVVTLVARYTAPNGRVTYSEPVPIPVIAQ
jgi:hypothetical protein